MLHWLRPPPDPSALMERARALHGESRFEEAADAYRRALELDARLPGAHELLGRALAAAGDHAAAVAALDAALRDNPGSVYAHFVRGLSLLALGDYAEGWKEFEWRWHRAEMQGIRSLFPQRWWDGSDIRGQDLLLFAEQGFGDAIQFARFVPELAARTGARIVLDCHPPLKGLLAQASGVREVLASDADISRYPLCFPLLSVPRALGTTLDSIPARVPYLHAPGQQASVWRSRLRAPGLRVGLAWASNPSAGYAKRKSLPLALLEPLARVPGISLYSLQPGMSAAVSEAPAMGIVDLGEELEDFSQTAGAVANLDLVISVDTALAHLAGAMAKPTWTLLRRAADWRWGLRGEASPWYPTMRLFRQQREGDWGSVVSSLAAALHQFARKDSR